MSETVLSAQALTKIYGSKRSGMLYKALDEVSLEVAKGEFVGVMGPSGSGKTTLLNLLATIDTPTSGVVKIGGVNPAGFKPHELALFRRKQLGFVFQDFNLLDTLSIRENIILPLAMEALPLKEIQAKVKETAAVLGIQGILEKRTYEVSGGQQQRAAVARAIIHNPSLLLADELTGNLDSKSAADVMNALQLLNEQRHATIMMVTHDPFAASYCRRIVFIKDGRVFSELRRGASRQTFFQQVLDQLSVLGGTVDDLASARSE